jgi:hypothetical protein
MAGAVVNIVAKEIKQIVAIFAPTRFAKMAKLSWTHVGVFMAGAVILPEGLFGGAPPILPSMIISALKTRKERRAKFLFHCRRH